MKLKRSTTPYWKRTNPTWYVAAHHDLYSLNRHVLILLALAGFKTPNSVVETAWKKE